jgi:hypothetical protein
MLTLAIVGGSSSVLPALAAGSSSATSDIKKFTYESLGKGIKITGYTGNDDVIVIPESIEGKAVTEIGDSAFLGNGASQVIIPSSVRRLDWGAFHSCRNLKQVTLSEGLQTIDRCVFLGTAIEQIDIPASVSKINTEVFSYCDQLKAIRVNELNKKYASVDGALLNRKMTELICVPSTKTGHYDVPDGVITIDTGAFSNSQLTEVSLPATVKKVDFFAFESCPALTTIMMDNKSTGNGKNLSTVDGVLYSKNMKTLVYYPEGKKDTAFTIPEGVTTITGNSQYLNNAYLSRVSLPDSLKATGNCVSECPNLEEIAVSATNRRYMTVDGVLFSKDMKTLLTYPAKKTTVNYTVPSSVKKIETDAFRNAELLQSLILQEGVTTIGSLAFTSCCGLKEMILPNTIKSIGFCAFQGIPMRSTFRLTVPDGVKKLDLSNFWGFWDTSKLIIVCSEGSVAYQYAVDHGIAHEPIPST